MAYGRQMNVSTEQIIHVNHHSLSESYKYLQSMYMFINVYSSHRITLESELFLSILGKYSDSYSQGCVINVLSLI